MLIRFTINSPGARELLRSSGVAAEIAARANRVKAAADARLATLEAPYPAVVVSMTRGANRVSATIGDIPMPLERGRRILGGAIDAAG